jgi:hypothetical protein
MKVAGTITGAEVFKIRARRDSPYKAIYDALDAAKAGQYVQVEAKDKKEADRIYNAFVQAKRKLVRTGTTIYIGSTQRAKGDGANGSETPVVAVNEPKEAEANG